MAVACTASRFYWWEQGIVLTNSEWAAFWLAADAFRAGDIMAFPFQQPYGGLRDSGNTREGPAFSVREMTEIRLVVLSP